MSTDNKISRRDALKRMGVAVLGGAVASSGLLSLTSCEGKRNKRIIFYFTGTGNCLYIARQLAGADTELLSIPQMLNVWVLFGVSWIFVLILGSTPVSFIYNGVLNLLTLLVFKREKQVQDEGLGEEYDEDDRYETMLKRKKAIEELAATLEEEHAEKVKEKTSGNTTPDKKEEFFTEEELEEEEEMEETQEFEELQALDELLNAIEPQEEMEALMEKEEQKEQDE